VCFLEVDKKFIDVFGILPRFLENLLESENLVFNATAGAKTALGIIQLWFNNFVPSVFKAVDIYFSWKQGRINHWTNQATDPGLMLLGASRLETKAHRFFMFLGCSSRVKIVDF